MRPAIGRRAVLLAGPAWLATSGAVAALPVTTVPVDTAGGRCVVAVLLDGKLARMVLDTGAERTLMTRAGARRLGLRSDPWVGTTMRGAGGLLTTHQNADIGAASLGGAALFQRSPGAGLSLSVGDFDLAGADGLLGGDILRHYTLVLDMPLGQLALWPAATPLPATGLVRLQRLRGDLLLAAVWLDGRNLAALVDTGASTTLINARGCYRLGLTPAALGGDAGIVSSSVGGTFRGGLHRFASLSVGPVQVPAPLLVTAPVPEMAYDMALGLDVLGRQRIAISYTSTALGFGG